MASERPVAQQGTMADLGFSTGGGPPRQALEIGMFVNYRARSHVLVGFTPMSVTPQMLELKDTDGKGVRCVESTDPDITLHGCRTAAFAFSV
jgi:hypothetical protein